MRRRAFIAGLGGAAAWPVVARAQHTEQVRRIGILLPATADDTEFQARVGAFMQEPTAGAGRRGRKSILARRALRA